MFPIVGIGASAGGLEALEQFLSNLPADCGMAFIIIQHLAPDRACILPELLQRATLMEVKQAGDRVRVQPNCVYVIPPNKDISIRNRTLHLSKPVESHGLHLPIDSFLVSLAKDCGEQSIGVILSGMGSDGTLGLKAIREQGGLTLAQEPATAKFDNMPRRGSISITVLAGAVEGTTCSLRFSIKDTGIGISPASLHKLFIPFSQVDGSATRRFGGTGLGLAISKQLIELMGGDIGVESSEGVGSTFFFRLPLEVATEQACEQKDLPVTVVQDGHRPEDYRILLVEDDYVNQRVMDTMLRKMGYRTGLAANGKEALDLLAAETFDLILMDCSMPVLDGYLSTEKIRETTNGVKNPEMPIIALTARAMQGDREKCLKAGMNDYLPKPVRFDELTTVLNRWLAPK